MTLTERLLLSENFQRPIYSDGVNLRQTSLSKWPLWSTGVGISSPEETLTPLFSSWRCSSWVLAGVARTIGNERTVDAGSRLGFQKAAHHRRSSSQGGLIPHNSPSPHSYKKSGPMVLFEQSTQNPGSASRVLICGNWEFWEEDRPGHFDLQYISLDRRSRASPVLHRHEILPGCR